MRLQYFQTDAKLLLNIKIMADSDARYYCLHTPTEGQVNGQSTFRYGLS